MAKPTSEWVVRPHGPLEKLTENLWRVQGSLPGMSLLRNMAIARMTDGRLVINSAIALEEPLMKEIEAWGKPAFLVIPNRYHRLDLPAFKRRYPDLTVLVPRGVRATVERVQHADGNFEDFPSNETVVLSSLDGIGDQEGVMTVESEDGITLILGDVVFNMDMKTDLLGRIFATLAASAPGPRVHRLFRLLVVKDRAVLRRQLERLAATPKLKRLIVAHEKLTTGGPEAAAVLRQAATYLA
jgi:hypothetical protein